MLVAIFVVPVAVGLIGFLLPARLTGWWATLGAFVSLVLAVVLLAGFDPAGGALQDVVDRSWIPQLGVRFQLGVDGLSIFLVLLTALLWAAAIVWSALQAPDRPRNYFFMLGLMQTATIGCFLAQDLLLFVLCFDLMLVPLYFLIGAWGTGDRIRATIKLIVYTLVGSLLMLVGAIATAVLSADAIGGVTFSIETLRHAPLADGTQYWIFCFFALAFLVKMPAILVHGWVVDAYRSCPLPVLILLGGMLPKVAAFGFLRIVIPVFPDASVHFQELLLLIGLGSMLYGSVMAFTRTNLRDIVAFSSIAQMGFITLGIFSLSSAGSDGSVLQMVNHALVVAPIFLIIAVLAERTGTEDLREMGGLAKRAPVLAAVFLIATMALLAIPGSANFVGEFFILKGVFETKVAIAVIASTGIAFAAFYALRMYQRTMHNPLPDGMTSREMTLREGVVLVPLVVCIVALALYPGLITTRGEDSVDRSLASLCDGSYGVAGEPADTADAGCPPGVEPQPAPEAVAGGNGGWTGYAPVAEVARR
jgi:NADH-quinone oxidoreductase subunit M